MGATGLVGRERELAAVVEAFDALARGDGRVLFFAGGAGLGKSRLATEAVALAKERSVVTAWGRCRETEGAPALWPWTQIMRTIRADVGDTLDRAMGADTALLAHVLPDLGPPDESADPFRTYDAMARALRCIAADRPLLLVLDDLHHADPGSLRMLRFVVGEIESSRVVVLGTYRDEELHEGHLLSTIVGEIATHRASRLFSLAGLDAPNVATIIASITGTVVDAAAADAVRERTGGNPFFVTEVARLGLDGPVPHGVREAIRARVRRLPDPTRAVLAIASVLGRDFGGELLEAVSDVRGISLVAALQPAAQARVITADVDRQGRYRFVHALVQEALYADLPDATRRSAHARAADALDALAESERSSRIAELAFHACAAIGDADSRTRASALCEAAARRAEDAIAHEDAARWFARARELDPTRAPLRLLFAEVDALARTPNVAGARTHYEEAFALAAREDDGASAARAALGVGDVVVSAGVIDQALVRMLAHAERMLPVEDVASIRLEARRAIELYWQADRREARATAASAVARAEASGDAKALGAALHARRFVLRGPDDLAARIAIGERLVALAIDTRDAEMELSGYAWLVPEYFAAGDVVAVDRAYDALDDLERRVRRPLARWNVLLFESMRAAFDGRLVDALATIERAQSLGRRIGSQPADIFAAGQRALVLRDLGRAAESIAELRALAASYPILVTLQCDLAMLLAEVDESAEARELLDRVARDDFAAVPRDSLWRASIALAAQAAATLGESAHARTAANLLRPFTGINVVQGVPIAWGATDHFVGIASAASGDLDAAVAHLDDAVRLHAAWGAMALRTASQAELANVLHQRGRAEDRQRVTGLEASVRAEAARLGIVRPLLGRDRRASGDRANATKSHGLTEQETKILKLLTAGNANKEIAQALRISVHTVERHLANLYAKIGARNRADAARFAVTNGLRD